MLKSLLQLLLGKFTKKSEFNSMLSSAFAFETTPTTVSLTVSTADSGSSNPVTAPFDAYVSASVKKPVSLKNTTYWAYVKINGNDFVYFNSYGDDGNLRTIPTLVRKGDSIAVVGAFMQEEGQNRQLCFYKFSR